MLRLMWTSALVAGTLLQPFALAHGQEDALAKRLGLNEASGSLPVWTKPDEESRRDLGRFVRQAQQGVMLVGYQHNHGTAWVVSKSHRLLATNAHVADILLEAKGKMFAILNETSTLYEVERVWYHPGVRRQVGGSLSRLYPDKPAEGPVDPHCPDVALLQLSENGPDLPIEMPMAGPDAFPALFGESAAILGYPAHDTSWPALGETASATFHDGVVSRLTNFQNSVSCDLAEKQFLQYTMSTWGGFSGSPILLPSGKVIALHNSARFPKNKAAGYVTSIARGIRIDSLWELLVYHKLTDKVPIPVDESALNVARWLKEDPHDTALHKARAIVEEAARLVYVVEDYANGAKKCSEAARLAPNYAPAYRLRAASYTNYAATYGERLTPQQRADQLSYAERDSKRAIQLNPSDPLGPLELAAAYGNAAVMLQIEADERRKFFEQAVEIAEKVMSVSAPDYVHAFAYSVRAAANDGLGFDAQAERDHNEAIRLNPTNANLYYSRSEFWRGRGRPDLQQKDLATAKKLRGG